jgi:hypothetical protein
VLQAICIHSFYTQFLLVRLSVYLYSSRLRNKIFRVLHIGAFDHHGKMKMTIVLQGQRRIMHRWFSSFLTFTPLRCRCRYRVGLNNTDFLVLFLIFINNIYGLFCSLIKYIFLFLRVGF